jgi:MinD-like ATPase involved in chromosome partitioning or flagellar assembly
VPIITVCGELVTTTSVALAAAWPRPDDAWLIEADPSGGDLAAWFDLPESPSLSTLVTHLRDRSAAELAAHRHLVGGGLPVVACPAMPSEADLAVAEAAAVLVPMLRDDGSRWYVVDIGRQDPWRHPFALAADVVVVVHRQSTQSARAAAVRLRRLPDRVNAALSAVSRVVVAVVGARPFDLGEITEFVTASVGGPVDVVGLADDPLAAAVLGGRSGVSERRLGRLPLVRSARDLAEVLAASHAADGSVGAR